MLLRCVCVCRYHNGIAVSAGDALQLFELLPVRAHHHRHRIIVHRSVHSACVRARSSALCLSACARVCVCARARFCVLYSSTRAVVVRRRRCRLSFDINNNTRDNCGTQTIFGDMMMQLLNNCVNRLCRYSIVFMQSHCDVLSHIMHKVTFTSL